MAQYRSILDKKTEGTVATGQRYLKFKDVVVYPRYCRSLPEMWPWVCEAYGNAVAIEDYCHNEKIKLTFHQLYEQFCKFAAGLQASGLQDKDVVSVFSENSSRWLVADQAVMMAGGINAVRGALTPVNELLYILGHSDSTVLIVENFELLARLMPALERFGLRFVVVLWPDGPPVNTNHYGVKILSYEDILSAGENADLRPICHQRDDLATLIYTSGTTGEPKGVMLSHGNLLHQVVSFVDPIPIHCGQKLLSVLPTWHAYERSCEYYVLSRGVTMVYSSVKTFKQDLMQYKPDLLIGVPRLYQMIYDGFWNKVKNDTPARKTLTRWLYKASVKYTQALRVLQNESINSPHPSIMDKGLSRFNILIYYPFYKAADTMIYKKVREIFGNASLKGVCGGGELARHVEEFFDILGIHLHVGYGLTEASPVVAVTTPERSFRGGVGPAIDETELQIVNPESLEPLKTYEKGLVLVRGPQVMKGYYKDQAATETMLLPGGWLNTGDLGYVTAYGDLVLTGRAKDVIVLSNGENVEPVPIENVCLQSPFIKQIMLTGTDKALQALVVPEYDSIDQHDEVISGAVQDIQAFREKIIKEEINVLVNRNSNFRPHERIQSVRVIDEPFSVENGLMTQTFKLRRCEIARRYEL